jgi:hypothetical protein
MIDDLTRRVAILHVHRLPNGLVTECLHGDPIPPGNEGEPSEPRFSEPLKALPLIGPDDEDSRVDRLFGRVEDADDD